jgi:hypothetical protein
MVQVDLVTIQWQILLQCSQHCNNTGNVAMMQTMLARYKQCCHNKGYLLLQCWQLLSNPKNPNAKWHVEKYINKMQLFRDEGCKKEQVRRVWWRTSVGMEQGMRSPSRLSCQNTNSNMRMIKSHPNHGRRIAKKSDKQSNINFKSSESPTNLTNWGVPQSLPYFITTVSPMNICLSCVKKLLTISNECKESKF